MYVYVLFDFFFNMENEYAKEYPFNAEVKLVFRTCLKMSYFIQQSFFVVHLSQDNPPI